MELAGVQRTSDKMPVVLTERRHQTASHQRNHRWNRLGLSRRVRSDATASLGSPKDSSPGTKPTVVHSLTPDCCSSDSAAMCRPLPRMTATVEKPTAR